MDEDIPDELLSDEEIIFCFNTSIIVSMAREKLELERNISIVPFYDLSRKKYYYYIIDINENIVKYISAHYDLYYDSYTKALKAAIGRVKVDFL